MTEPLTAIRATQCPLSWSEQRQNLILFAVCTALQYLAAPVLYVGITQASLCNRLGADTRTSNLPGTLYFAMTAMPALIAWFWPRVSQLKRNLSACFTINSLMLLTLAVSLASSVPTSFKLAMIVLQGAVSGAVMPAAMAMQWEILGRGSDDSRRGLALGLAFGAGPVLAVFGSLIQTMLLGGDLFGWHFDGLPHPTSFIVLFASAIPVMAIASIVTHWFVIVPEPLEPSREPASAVIGLLIGLPLMFIAVTLTHLSSHAALKSDGPVLIASASTLLQILGILAGAGAVAGFAFHFRSILRQRVLLLATIVTVFVYCGNVIPSNMNLYSQEVLVNHPDQYAGVQNMLRFGFKVIAGSMLGWLLVRTNPRAGLLATSLIFLTAQLWAMFASGPWYLVAFGLHGAGELVGVYAPNYIVSASPKDQMRRNTAFMTMLMVPAAPAGYLYGAIVDTVKRSEWTWMGMNSITLGYRLSFAACASLIFCGIMIAVFALPATPTPETTRDHSDNQPEQNPSRPH